MPDSTPKTIGKYEILSVLGKGGMGIVYKARDPFIDRVVAIKTIDADQFVDDNDLVARLRMEARSAGRLQHPNIVIVYELGEFESMAFLAMEYVEGANLANVIASGVHIALNTKLDIITQICDGVAYAHDMGVIHRDLKPSNICLTQRGDPKILDFGLARFDQTRLTKTGLTSGTLMYMSPERMRGETGPSDDIFALGAIAYEILTGRHAFPGKGFREIVQNITSGNYPIPPSRVIDVPKDLDAVIAKATAINKDLRFASAADLGRALREVQHSQTFQRRAQADAASISDSMKTVAIQFSMNNPYTAPDIAPEETTAVRPDDVYLARTEAQSVEAFSQASFGLDSTAEKTTVSPALVRPDSGQDALASAPTEFVPAPRLTRPEPVSSTSHDSVTGAMTSPHVAARGASATGEDSLITRTRTVVANAFRKREPSGASSSAPKPKSGGQPAAAKSGGHSTQKRRRSPGTASAAVRAMPARPVRRPLLYGGAIVLAVAIASYGTAAAAGVFPRILVYAAAIAGWMFLWNHSGGLKKMQVALLGVVLCALAAVVPIVEPPQLAAELAIGKSVLASQANPATSGSVAPFASALLAGWAAIGGSLLARRLLGAIAVLVSGWLLWDKERPRNSMGVLSFPLLLIEGIIYARLEVIAAALLVAAAVATTKRRYGLSALHGVLASGVTISAIAGLPVLYGAAWHVIVWLGAAAVTLVVPKIILPSVTGWTTSLSSLASSSPVLSFLNGRVASLLTEWGVIDVMNAFSKAVTTRAGTAARVASPEVLATLIIVVAIFVAISVIAARAETLEAAMADGLGLFLILTMTRETALWMLVAPFAIASSRRLWLLVVICSPLLMFATGDARSALPVWAMSLGIPLAGFIALKLQKEPAPQPSKA